MKENPYIRLLRHRCFLCFWGATTLLRLASNVLQFALAMYVLERTGSAFVYSTVLAVILLPRLLLTPIAGALADLRDSIRILRRGTLCSSGLMACVWIVHGVIVPLGLPMIYALVICLEICETLLAPAEGKALPCIVAEGDLAPAAKLSSLDDGVVELLSPVLAAAVYAPMGLTGVLGIAFLMEGAAFLLSTRIEAAPGPVSAPNTPICSFKTAVAMHRDAIRCLKEQPAVVGILLFAPLFNFFASPLFSVTAPHYFRITMQGGVDAYAAFHMVLGAAGLTAPFLAMLCIGDREEAHANEGGVLAAIAVLLCLAVILQLHVSVRAALIAFTTAMALLTAIITVMSIATSISVKKRIPMQLLGRMISLIQLFAVISVPLGQLLYGICTDHAPVWAALLLSAAGLILTLCVMVRTYRSIRTP